MFKFWTEQQGKNSKMVCSFVEANLKRNQLDLGNLLYIYPTTINIMFFDELDPLF